MYRIVCFILFLSSYVSSSAQLSVDLPISEEITRIIQNYHQHQIDSFKIIYKENGRVLELYEPTVFYYRFINDSMFEYQWGETRHLYKMKGEGVEYLRYADPKEEAAS